MSVCKDFGKDKVVFITKEDYATPSKVELPDLPEEYNRGLILSNGNINFNCPCLGGMASGPCGFEFRDAFSCFYYSKSETKGSECLEKFMEMQTCMSKYPVLYSKENSAMNTEPENFDQLEKYSIDSSLNNQTSDNTVSKASS